MQSALDRSIKKSKLFCMSKSDQAARQGSLSNQHPGIASNWHGNVLFGRKFASERSPFSSTDVTCGASWRKFRAVHEAEHTIHFHGKHELNDPDE